MSTVEGILKIRAEGRELLKEISNDLEQFGHVQEDTRHKMAQFRTDTMASNRVLSGLGAAFKEAHQSAYLLAGAFSQAANIARTAATMFTQYNVAMIRTSQLTKEVVEAQEAYNNAVNQFGAGSAQAQKAAEQLASAQAELAQSHQQNIIMLGLFATQLPGLAMHVLDLQKKLMLLKGGNEALTASFVALRAAIVGVEVAISVLSGVAIVKLLEQFGGPATKGALQSWSKLLKDIAVSLGLMAPEIESGVKTAIEPARKIFVNLFLSLKQEIAQQMPDIIAAFKEAFTGPFAEIGSVASLAMERLVNATNLAIQQGLIGTAQAGMAAFRDCISNKLWDMPGLAGQAMEKLVSLTNNAINSGLKGEAQKNMALFVQCASSKELSMVNQIDGYLKQLQDKYAENQRMITILTMQGQLERAALYQQENVNIQAAIAQLKQWQDALLKGGKLPTAKIQLPDMSSFVDEFWANYETLKTAAGDKPVVVTINVDSTLALANIAVVQNALNALHDKTITVTVNYVTWGEPPSFQRGGVVPGPIGQPQLVIAHGGERFLGAPTQNVTSHNTFNQNISSNMDLDIMQKRIETAMVSGYRRLRDIS